MCNTLQTSRLTFFKWALNQAILCLTKSKFTSLLPVQLREQQQQQQQQQQHQQSNNNNNNNISSSNNNNNNNSNNNSSSNSNNNNNNNSNSNSNNNNNNNNSRYKAKKLDSNTYACLESHIHANLLELRQAHDLWRQIVEQKHTKIHPKKLRNHQGTRTRVSLRILCLASKVWLWE